MHLLDIDVAYQSKDKLEMRLSSWYRRKLFHKYVYSVSNLESISLTHI